jgi:hypothetical protein
MYEWLETEIPEIETPEFHVVECNKVEGILPISKEFYSSFPPSYVAFITKFGRAKLYRKDGYYQVGVLNPPQEKILNNGQKLWFIGYFDDSKAYFLASQLIPGRESPVYEWTEDDFEKIADSFEEWLTIRCTDARESYNEKEWKEILNRANLSTEEEEARVEARKQFQWQVVEFDKNRNVKIAVRNNSNRVLPDLTIGMRTKNPTQDGQVWESGIYLNVSDIQPGQKRIIEHQIHQEIFTPDNTEFFQLASPLPEERHWKEDEKSIGLGKTLHGS